MACILVCPYCEQTYLAGHGSETPCSKCAQRFFGKTKSEIKKILAKDKEHKDKRAIEELKSLGFPLQGS